MNSVVNNSIKDFIVNDMHLSWDLGSPFSSYLDISAIVLTIVLFTISLFGIEVAAVFNNTLAIINILLLCLVTVGGVVYGDFENLKRGNFTEGFNGVIKGLISLILRI
jgi:amino acid transporter